MRMPVKLAVGALAALLLVGVVAATDPVCLSTNEAVCDGQCKDLSSDPTACGQCGFRCDKPGQTCVNGQCLCPVGQTMCFGWCEDLMTNREHCGKCGKLCDPGNGCTNGYCDNEVPCAANELKCNLQCVDPLTSSKHCGDCGAHCDKPGQQCVNGQCLCPAGQTLCNGWCQDLMTNREHCGKCGKLCNPGNGCSDGICDDEQPCITQEVNGKRRSLTTTGHPCVPPPPPLPTCPPNAWSLTYTQGFWRSSFCAKVLGGTTGSCNSASPSSACGLTLPAFGSLPSNLQAIVTATCGELSGVGSTELQICECFARVSGGTSWNALGIVFNTLLARVGTPGQPSGPSNTCQAAAVYLPIADTFVCTRPGATAPCACPTVKVSQWGVVSTDCRTLVNESSDEGKCLPAVTGNCQVQSCPCESRVVAASEEGRTRLLLQAASGSGSASGCGPAGCWNGQQASSINPMVM